MRFICPVSMRPHAAKALAGEYDIPGLDLGPRPRVIDVGANVGAFSFWAAKRWPGCEITAYEPVPGNARMLRQNVQHLGSSRVSIIEAAVTSLAVGRMRLGKNNCGEASLYELGEQGDIAVDAPVRHPSSLGDCELLKLDCEGSELDVVQNVSLRGISRAVVLEWHGAANRYGVGNILAGAHFDLVSDVASSKERGIQKWIRSS